MQTENSVNGYACMAQSCSYDAQSRFRGKHYDAYKIGCTSTVYNKQEYIYGCHIMVVRVITHHIGMTDGE